MSGQAEIRDIAGKRAFFSLLYMKKGNEKNIRNGNYEFVANYNWIHDLEKSNGYYIAPRT